MNDTALERLSALQEELVGALDSGKIERIEAAIDALAAAVDDIRVERSRNGERELARAAIEANHAARIRVNFLTDSVRRRIAALSALRGSLPDATYRPAGG